MRKKISPGWIVLDVLIGTLALAFIIAVFMYGDRLLQLMKTPELVTDAEMPQQYFFSATEWWDEDFPNRAIREEKPWSITPEEAAAAYEEYLAGLSETKQKEIQDTIDYLSSIEVQKKLSNRIHNFNRAIDVDEISNTYPAIDPDGKPVVIYKVHLSHTEYDDDDNETVTRMTLFIYGRLPEEE